ncbi:MAG: hypothetical protein KAV87_05295 [Desulfobacteraceae bacterium]|nr:hypothetical protein [Desulfobacteraceae bacterium]
MKYSIAFKNKMVKKMAGPQAITGTVLSQEIDLSQTALSRWLREAGELNPL